MHHLHAAPRRRGSTGRATACAAEQLGGAGPARCRSPRPGRRSGRDRSPRGRAGRRRSAARPSGMAAPDQRHHLADQDAAATSTLARRHIAPENTSRAGRAAGGGDQVRAGTSMPGAGQHDAAGCAGRDRDPVGSAEGDHRPARRIAARSNRRVRTQLGQRGTPVPGRRPPGTTRRITAAVMSCRPSTDRGDPADDLGGLQVLGVHHVRAEPADQPGRLAGGLAAARPGAATPGRTPRRSVLGPAGAAPGNRV